MNILIENAETFEYLTHDNQWTKKPANGKNFGATDSALAIAKLEPIGKFNVVAYIPESRQFINMQHGRGKGIPEIAAA